MTIETKTTIQLSDIATVEFECKQCHSISAWPLKIATAPPLRCHCTDQQWMIGGGETYEGIKRLIGAIQRFTELTSEPFIMRFGLAPSGHVSDEKD